jgi:hypothetical protein
MTKVMQARRTTDELLELARVHAPNYGQELSVLLGEVLLDLGWLETQLREPPQEKKVGELIADIRVDCQTLARKCLQLRKLLDKVWDKIPDEINDELIQR